MNLSTPEDVLLNADRVIARVVAQTMPPAGGPSAGEAQRFLNWLNCGAPGVASDPAALEPEVSSAESGEFNARPLVLDDFPEGLTLQRDLGSEEGRLVEWLLVDGDDAWLVGWDDGEVGALYDPPLQVAGSNLPDEVPVIATVWDADGSWEEEQVWTIRTESEPSDPRVRGLELVVTNLSEASGDLHRFEVASVEADDVPEGLSSRTIRQGGTTWWMITSPGLFFAGMEEGFPIQEDLWWGEFFLRETAEVD